MRYNLFGLGGLLSSLALANCSDPEPDNQREPVPVVAQSVRILPEQAEVEAIGTARAATSAEVYAESAGRVTEVLFSAGDYVRKGAPLLRTAPSSARVSGAPKYRASSAGAPVAAAAAQGRRLVGNANPNQLTSPHQTSPGLS